MARIARATQEVARKKAPGMNTASRHVCRGVEVNAGCLWGSDSHGAQPPQESLAAGSRRFAADSTALGTMSSRQELTTLDPLAQADWHPLRGSLRGARSTGSGDPAPDGLPQEKSPPISGGLQSAKGGSRTPTALRPLEPESSASASSATFAVGQIISSAPRTCQVVVEVVEVVQLMIFDACRRSSGPRPQSG